MPASPQARSPILVEKTLIDPLLARLISKRLAPAMRASAVATDASHALEGLPVKKQVFSAQSPAAKMFGSLVIKWRSTAMAPVEPRARPACLASSALGRAPMPRMTASAFSCSPLSSSTVLPLWKPRLEPGPTAWVPVTIQFGIAPKGDGLDGHCWLELEGEPVAERLIFSEGVLQMRRPSRSSTVSIGKVVKIW